MKSLSHDCLDLEDEDDILDVSAAPVINEVDAYLTLKLADEEWYTSSKPMHWVSSFNVFKWWESHRYQFPTLYKIAIRFLSTPCASSFCELIFSTGAMLPSQCRPGALERRIQLAHNLHIAESGSCALLGPDLKLKLQQLDDVGDADGAVETEASDELSFF